MQLCVCIWRYKIIKWVILLKVVLFLIVYKRSAYIDQYQIQSIDCAIFIDYDFVSWFCWFLFICYYLLLIFLRPFNGKKWNLAMKVHWVFFLKGGWSLKVVTNIANPFAKQTPNEYLEGAESNLILPNFGSSTHILIRHIHIPHIGLLNFSCKHSLSFLWVTFHIVLLIGLFLEQTFYNGLEIHRCLSNLKLKDLMFHCSCFTYLLFTFLWFTF